MTEFELIIPGKPQPKRRARTFRNKKTGKICTNTPEETVRYENLIMWYFAQKYPRFKPLETAVKVNVVAVFKIPKKKKDKQFPLTDIDNIVKTVLDALNKLAYQDDRQVTEIEAKKRWINGEEMERIEVKISEIGDDV